MRHLTRLTFFSVFMGKDREWVVFQGLTRPEPAALREPLIPDGGFMIHTSGA